MCRRSTRCSSAGPARTTRRCWISRVVRGSSAPKYAIVPGTVSAVAVNAAAAPGMTQPTTATAAATQHALNPSTTNRCIPARPRDFPVSAARGPLNPKIQAATALDQISVACESGPMAVAFTDGALALASHGRRIAAALLDGVLGTAILGACGAAGFGVGLIGAGGTDSEGWETLGWILVGTILGVDGGRRAVGRVDRLARPPPRGAQRAVARQAAHRHPRRARGPPRDRRRLGVAARVRREVHARRHHVVDGVDVSRVLRPRPDRVARRDRRSGTARHSSTSSAAGCTTTCATRASSTPSQPRPRARRRPRAAQTTTSGRPRRSARATDERRRRDSLRPPGRALRRRARRQRRHGLRQGAAAFGQAARSSRCCRTASSS